MSIHIALHHVTHYRYERAVALGPQVVRLRPAAHSRTRVLSYSLKVLPQEHFINWQQDPQGNYLARLVFPEKTRELRIEVDLVAELAVFNPFDFFLELYAEKIPFRYTDDEQRELGAFLETLPLTPRFAAYLDSIERTPTSSIDFLVALNQRVNRDIGYLIRMEPGVQTPEQTLEKASGSCRDSAWLLVQLLRHLGLAARFVSGYLIQLKADQQALDGPSGTDVDFTDLHAWCEVYLPGAGWVGLDATSGLLAGEGHIPLACSPEPSSAAPVSGLIEPCESEFSHSMSVERIWEAPRVTRPYSDAQWSEILALGQQIDQDLQRDDVRLTMGGEPTFVSIDDRDGAEWNTAALGPSKRRLSAELFHRLRAHYAPNALVHFGQGKWYPGEQLPRWSLNCFWRRDGQPVWRNPALIADEGRDYGANSELAGVFLASVAERLGLAASRVFPAYEDNQYYLWREGQLPVNLRATDSRLDDELERARLRKVFEQGLGAVIGQVLPLARTAAGDAWQTGPWHLRGEHCRLVPGDSPVGYRLPLNAQAWAAPEDYPYVHPQDPNQPLSPLPARATPVAAASTERAAPQRGESAGWVVRTALCAQAREGRLYLFMPPLQRLEDYLELVAVLEDTAAELNCPVLLEGYEPPADPRLANFRITPDPGVIEVNVQPSASWDELVERTEFLYEQARLTRLSTEKFMIDGRHTGTGGGNHFVLGGATPGDSPFLRRPDLLRSLISYWHNHPSLSYLFSGLFIGPTSQAPRIDEARNDSLYELEVAFAQFPEPGEAVAPWLVDRLLRNLLIDVTGNTHRAEFCIDKLYSPDSASGRLGLLELRAFEMPPHARMSLVQQLLLRALVARFWREPYAPPRLARWGTELHDRFMLPYFIEQDFADVIAELNAAGYPLRAEWFAAHLEFRFPKVGDYAVKGIELELRQALEPWHVLGEEGTAGGTVRYVDSSLERLQVRLNGLPPQRYVLTCNGLPVPLQPTGRAGEFVAGVRYRAWQPANCLQPTIGVHAPLVFDLVDTWMQRSLGGCEYHVAHPGGRNYETLPVNGNEAESRRLARFFRVGHTPGQVEVTPLNISDELPMTLDMRRHRPIRRG
ncbi:transglutaminase family protein [Pseudomonas sp. DTU_2021_1001937_2_SI_NGA_ILE_001]|uniref:transglutaminase family protein n=1 Tax=Pseudomonas sp. DTU_2021_1001937_2_SI_NGA_ILE_001 TaxID=3077589 RepID=UPI0028FC2253|nr:transglutaminase family protein [Pseudomonas sp. DTU_2021_1001937_2_SI_NGA_ILE_001]WNW13139.1 transglutaminase family protein [Pseudomonas sp. DTU_2021_1001937_2_SI_NGA_ILE_001]